MNKQNDCQKRREAITAFALGELEHQAADELKKHIDTCETCRSLYHALVDEEETIRSAFQAIADRSETLQNSLVKQLDKHDLSVPQIYIGSRKTVKVMLSAIMKSPITKLAAAAVIVLTVIISINQFGKPVGFTTIAFADISEAMKNVSWMHQISSGFQRGITGSAELWVGFKSKIFASKDAKGKIIFWNVREHKKYKYDPQEHRISIDYASEDDFPLNLSSPASLLESMHKMMKEQGAQIITKQGEYNGQRAQVQEISISSVGLNNESHTLRLYIQPHSKLLFAAQVKGVDANGDVVMDGEIEFEYPNSGPKDIYDLGVPRAASVVNNLPQVDVSEVLANYRSHREKFPHKYIVIVTMEWPRESVKPGVARITYCNGMSMMTERHIAKRRTANWREYPNETEPNFYSLLSWWTSNKNSELREVFLYDGKYDYYVYDLPNRLKNYRTKGHNPNHKGLDDISWPNIDIGWIGSGQELKIVETDYAKRNNFNCIELLFSGRVDHSGKHVTLPQKSLYYLDQQRDCICIKQEDYQLRNAPWQKDKSWLDGVDPNIIPEDLTSIREVAELARTDTGQWYPKKIKTWLNNDTAKLEEPTHIETVYLKTNPQFPKGIFDSKNLPK